MGTRRRLTPNELLAEWRRTGLETVQVAEGLLTDGSEETLLAWLHQMLSKKLAHLGPADQATLLSGMLYDLGRVQLVVAAACDGWRRETRQVKARVERAMAVVQAHIPTREVRTLVEGDLREREHEVLREWGALWATTCAHPLEAS